MTTVKTDLESVNLSTIADIQLATDTKDTKVEFEDIPNFTIDESTNNIDYKITA